MTNIMIMLAMRPGEVTKLKIKKYEPQEPLPKWWVSGCTWYVTGYIKSRGKSEVPREYLSMEKCIPALRAMD